MKKTKLLTIGLSSLLLLTACSTQTNHSKMTKETMTKSEKAMTKKMKEKDMMTSEQKMKNQDMSKENSSHLKAAPQFSLQGVDGKKYTLSDFKGKKVYVKFWASWCSICLSTLPDTTKLAKNATSDLVVLSVVSPNHNGEKSESDFKKWFKTLDYKALPVVLDKTGKVLSEYGVRSYPTQVFIDKEGNLVKKHVGYMSEKEVKETLNKIK
ncbi:hypothetical protein HMPREF9318_00026 [Streptococcus urinalis FB127-CNA-2]|uniref:Redoxin n=1 Tax=Streptococcus urinalis 2285-97 TaxID=764291 RepID=G5KE51_9STRE|nr:redoxin family protein [Streptococcus urinalis]EHJ57321.1 redoxin [Streptococcus urinalis 2285-97]EKS21828.1 hypothetical protein HMPREF9318_00026 [Streptococcus urinalis FB127-CNA-2]VEF31641.1 thiol:disulfide oxidoreductase [Streptococcus urinalis]